MKTVTSLRYCLLAMLLAARPLTAQLYDPADRGEPGDAMIQSYLAAEAMRIDAALANDVQSSDVWRNQREQWLDEYYYMLGLERPIERTPLSATVTGSYVGDGFVVELLHFQSRPGLYVTCNLYRPAASDSARRPAVLYVCGHSSRGRNGNKTAFQSHGIWFARHGYVCLLVDSLQLGEIPATHHGTYREQRWWWHSRGYTPAGVECLNGIRAIDYLQQRPDVDPERIAVTGISGGGAASFWIAAADERVRVAVPVSGMADLPSYVGNRVINGHCDCMFLHNTFQWPWPRIAGLIAPRPLLFVNSDLDSIFPMDANERVSAALERTYRLCGTGDMVDSVVSIGGHAYREDIRRAAYRFINLHLANDSSPIADTEVDLVIESDAGPQHPIDPVKLRAFPTDADLPTDSLNSRIDELFVPLAEVQLPATGEFAAWKDVLLRELRRVVLRPIPERIPAAAATAADLETDGAIWLNTEPGIRVRLLAGADQPSPDEAKRLVLLIANPGSHQHAWVEPYRQPGDRVLILEPRGIGATQWTRSNPPNYVERAHVLLGRSADLGRIWDVAATVRYLKESHASLPLVLAANRQGAVLAAYAGILESGIDQFVLEDPSFSHMDADAPQLLNALRVGDVPFVVGMLAPRPVVLQFSASNETAAASRFLEIVSAAFAAAGADQHLQAAQASVTP